jgi:hypothetical protein
MRGNLQVRFLGEPQLETVVAYPTVIFGVKTD